MCVCEVWPVTSYYFCDTHCSTRSAPRPLFCHDNSIPICSALYVSFHCTPSLSTCIVHSDDRWWCCWRCWWQSYILLTYKTQACVAPLSLMSIIHIPSLRFWKYLYLYLLCWVLFVLLLYCIIYVCLFLFVFVCTGVRTTATEWQLNCSNYSNNIIIIINIVFFFKAFTNERSRPFCNILHTIIIPPQSVCNVL